MVNHDISFLDNKGKAKALRKQLLKMGYKHLVYCDTNETGCFSFNYYSLSKEDVILNDSSCCSLPIRLDSDEVLSYLEAAMDQIFISPDLTAIDIHRETNEDPIIEHERKNEERSIKFKNERVYAQRARQLQQKLIDKGYKCLEFCDENDDGVVFSKYYNLSKDDEIAKPDSCILYTRIPIESDRAYNVFRSWVSQIVINADLRTL